MTKQQLITKINELEKWLTINSPEHKAKPQIERDLRDLKQQLDQKDFEDHN